MLTREQMQENFCRIVKIGQGLKGMIRELYRVPGMRSLPVGDPDAQPLERWMRDFILALIRELEISQTGAADCAARGRELLMREVEKLDEGSQKEATLQTISNHLLLFERQLKAEDLCMKIDALDLLAVCAEREGQIGRKNTIKKQINRFFIEIVDRLEVGEAVDMARRTQRGWVKK